MARNDWSDYFASAFSTAYENSSKNAFEKWKMKQESEKAAENLKTISGILNNGIAGQTTAHTSGARPYIKGMNTSTGGIDIGFPTPEDINKVEIEQRMPNAIKAATSISDLIARGGNPTKLLQGANLEQFSSPQEQTQIKNYLDLGRNIAAGKAKTRATEEKEYKSALKEFNPYKASTRTPIGRSVMSNQQIDLAMEQLKGDKVTEQDLDNALSAIGNVYMSDPGEYTTMQQKFGQYKQFLSGRPQNVVSSAIRDRVMQELKGIRQYNDTILQNGLNYMESSYPRMTSKNKAEWQKIKEGLVSKQGASTTGGTKAFVVGGKTYNIPENMIEEFKKAKGLK